jgi:hypothetical protein
LREGLFSILTGRQYRLKSTSPAHLEKVQH